KIIVSLRESAILETRLGAEQRGGGHDHSINIKPVQDLLSDGRDNLKFGKRIRSFKDRNDDSNNYPSNHTSEHGSPHNGGYGPPHGDVPPYGQNSPEYECSDTDSQSSIPISLSDGLFDNGRAIEGIDMDVYDEYLEQYEDYADQGNEDLDDL
ncbi:hypothetical protein BGZ58_004031, partial [Dissophora ornata]